jgi:hypothetical protein
MSEAIGWNHPPDQSDQWDGFNDMGMAHFTGNPYPFSDPAFRPVEFSGHP